MSITRTLPGWLNNAFFDGAHFANVYTLLSEREAKRERARSASRNRDDDSKTRRAGKAFIAPFSRTIPSDHLDHYSIEYGSRPEHLPFNRYYAIEPHERTRVGVCFPASSDDEYLNANWVRELHGGQWWIATQAPLPNTAYAYLSLFFQPATRPPPSIAGMREGECTIPPEGECRLRTSVQLTVAYEGGRTKAHPYFPTEVGESYVIPPPPSDTTTTPHPRIKIKLASQTVAKETHSITSRLQLSLIEPDSNAERGQPFEITHHLFTHWPDFGIPSSPEDQRALLAFVRFVAASNRLTSTPEAHLDPPIALNCSAGIGRTGSFIALSSLLRSHGLLLSEYPPTSPTCPFTSVVKRFPSLPPSPLGPLPDFVAGDEVVFEIDSLREQRTSMVQRDEQHLLIYHLLREAYNERYAEEEQKQWT
ncbi:phosphatases II [Schizopora paradoxa]|uniref:Phosphatases II n=1 Tax=Schizopora paradoxa TaxID=27342 RepID=A0A0H2RN76_9AGAM|nr:phosphatases II [Schizopora paradoxa]